MKSIANKDNSYYIKLQERGVFTYWMIDYYETESNALGNYEKLCKEFKVKDEYRVTYPFTLEIEDIIIKDKEIYLKKRVQIIKNTIGIEKSGIDLTYNELALIY